MKHFSITFLLFLIPFSGTIRAELDPADVTIVETVLRMESFKLQSSEKATAAVGRYLDARKGTEEYFRLIERFDIKDRVPDLLGIIQENPASTAGITALNLVLKLDEAAIVAGLKDPARAPALNKGLGIIKHPTYGSAAAPAVTSASVPALPMPEIAHLVKKTGDVGEGKKVYGRLCAVCHLPSDVQIDFGPNLSEIGSKLPKSELYTAILEPSAGVSFGFEGWQITMKNGAQFSGLVPSQTDDELSLVMIGGVKIPLKKSEITERKMMKQSLMPPGLHQAMTEAELVHLVEYLASMKKKG
ncbi:MAG: putative heme-binding domain-containing protein [Kiritimatiellia bacterium]|jgi:putative heme-binding domain-containing protein